MSSSGTGDVSLINDEDLLRRMWQDTEDFGRKKEIRAHMYKLREARLREFYNSGEVKTDIQKSSRITTENTSKSCSASTHADSLADHSFISMKTKEIRDSESPTKDDIYRVTDRGLANQGWNVVTSNKTSDDGKTFTTSKVATTSGAEKIEGGQLNYAAKNEQQATVYKDGDDRNFTKAVGASSNTFIKQEGSGGDENSSFKCSSTKTSSSSKYVTESRSTSDDVTESRSTRDDITENQPTSRIVSQNQNNDYLVSRKTYTENIPSELKKHPNYVEGKTKVTQETRALPDGTTVTTTRYEIRGGSTSQAVRSGQHTSEQRISSSSSSVRSSQSQALKETQTTQNEAKTNKYISEQPSSTTTTITRQIFGSKNQDLQPATTTEFRTKTVSDQQVARDEKISKTTIQNSQKDDNVKVTSVRKVNDYTEEPRIKQDSNITVVKRTHGHDLIDDSVHNTNVSTTSRVEKQEYGFTNEKNVNEIKDISNTTRVVKEVYSREEPYITRDVKDTTITSIKDARPTVTNESDNTTVRTTVVKQICDTRNQAPVVDNSTNTSTVKTTIIRQVNDSADETRRAVDQSSKIDKLEINDNFVRAEIRDNQLRMEQPKSESVPSEQRPKIKDQDKIPEKRITPQENYEQPERRQPIKPGKSELDAKSKPTEGQYDTTYRSDYTNKRISVDVSPTHEAFARSLRAVSPDRLSKCSSPSRSLRTSNNSLRSSTSPEKMRHPSRVSPERRSTSPRKTTSNETITYRTKTTTDKISKTNTRTEIDSSTLTRKKNTTKSKSRSSSPTSVASDIDFIRNTNIVTDLDTNETTLITNSRPSSLDITKKTTRKVTQRSPTSPLTDTSPKKSSPRDVSRTSSLRNISPTKENPKSDRPLKRTDTYEERCRQILGITNETSKRRSSLEKPDGRRGSGPKTIEKTSPKKEILSPTQKPSFNDFAKNRGSPEKQSPKQHPDNNVPQKQKSPKKETPKRNAYQEPLEQYPEKQQRPTENYKISEFPSQIRRSPEKEPLEPYPEKKSPIKDSPKINEFPSQIRRSSEKEPLEPYPEKKSPIKDSPKINEFPSQIRRSPEKEPLEPYPEKKSSIKDSPKINEFPSQIRRSSEKEPLEPYPERKSPIKDSHKINEFPSQIRRSPEKEPLEPYPEKKSSIKDSPKINEFPSQIRRSPEKEPLEPYPEKKSTIKDSPKINEFPSQIRKSPEKEPLEPYPEKKNPIKDSPKINEFPSQTRKSPEKEPLEPYPEKKSTIKDSPKINEFPSQIRRSPEKEPLEPYPEKKSPMKDSPKINEFPSQIRRSPEKEPLEPYPEKKSILKDSPKISEFPSQIRKSPEKEPLEPYSKKEEHITQSPTVHEFPSQVRRSPEKEPLEPYPEKKIPTNYVSKISEFPSQIKTAPEKEPLGPYPEKETQQPYDKKAPLLDISDVCEFPLQIIKPSNYEQSEPYFEKQPRNETPKESRGKVQDQVPKPDKRPQSVEKKAADKFKPTNKETIKTSEYPQQKRKSPEQVRPEKEGTKINKPTAPVGRLPEKEQKIKPQPTDAIRTLPSKNNKPIRQRKESSSSSSSAEDETEIDEIFTSTEVTGLEGRVPVDEPLATKKFIAQLCKDDEIQRNDLRKAETQSILHKKTLSTGSRTPSKIVKKDSVKKPEELFIENEKKDNVKKYISSHTSPTKKPLTEKNNISTTRTINKTTKTDLKVKLNDNKVIQKDVKKGKERITLMDIENLNKNKEDNRTHIRTHRVDDTVNKRITKTTVNGDITRKTQVRYNQPVKNDEPKVKTPINKKPQKQVTRTTIVENELKRNTSEQKTPKRHVVTTTITVTSPRKPSPAKTTTKSTPKTTNIKSAKTTTLKAKPHNGHVSSDDESITDSLDDKMTQEISSTLEKKLTRTTSDQTNKKKTDINVAIRGTSRSDIQQSKVKQEKCITTKSIVINNEENQREIIVDLQRSKSSREPTPDRICPLPVSSDDESTPRYPDQIAEPDDSTTRYKIKKISNIPILENEDVIEFSKITEVDHTSSINIDREEESDVSLLSVDKKINRFSTTTEKPTKLKEGPAPKINRPRLEVTEDLESDECLLSVSEKVNKFITTAEQLTASQDVPQRPKSPKCQFYTEDDVSVSDKVTHFINTAEEIVSPQKSPSTKVERPSVKSTDETFKTDKISTLSNKTEKVTSSSDSKVSLSKIDVKTSKKSQEEQQKRETTPTRRPSNQYSSIKTDTYNKHPSRDSSPKLPDSTPKTTKRPSEEEPKSVLSPLGRLRSTETVKKAKALFENINKHQESPKQRNILNRPSVFEDTWSARKDVSRKLDYESEEDKKTLKSTRLILEKVHPRPKSPEKDSSSRRSQSPDGDLPGYMRPLDRSLRPNSPHREKHSSRRSQSPDGDLPGYMRPLDRSLRPNSPHREKHSSSRRSQSPDGDLPGYMRPLDRSLRPNSPQRENVNQLNQIVKKHTNIKDDGDTTVSQTKFGVTLKRTDSGRAILSSTSASIKTQVCVEQVTEEEIENIFVLEILEELLERVIGYDLRRKIRTQIRLVKKMISEGKLDETTKINTIKEKSPPKTVTSQTKQSIEKTSEYRSSHSYSSRKSSSEYTKVTRRSQSPEEKQSRVPRRSKSPDIKPQRVIRKSQSPELKPDREKSPTKTTKLFNTQLKKTSPSSKPTTEENTPEWVKQRNLRKISDTTVTRNVSTTTSKKTRSSPAKETKSTDIITSSYGVGPTDENGTPLFGLKALRTQSKTGTTKVQGAVIKSQYYSENGEEPVGEISVTKYSTDPKDLGRSDDVKTKGITSITTTQKFGYKDTPSLKSLTKSKKTKEICDNVEDEIETKTTKINRRGSVKALSQKFIENAVETSKNERQSSYPKAGLILRTSSFKESASSGDSREGSTERTVTTKTSTSKTVSGETFLTSRTKVTGMQDVISRMKSEDVREGDTAEDVEARGLLNKFLGAQVILSGIESNVKSSTTTANSKRITKVTTTVTERGKPVTKTRVFQHPITDEDLQTVWDEQTLRLLLEQSTDYDERRRIRGRLRQVMAEQEACTDSVDKVSQDQIGSSTFEGESQLLPLLQGLLEAPDNEQTADSGTESGEDQRSGLINEVQNALDKLAANLRDDATDITPEKRSSLLQLVTKLQAGLAASVPTSERRSSVQGRFRRRQRPNRHTVGVSSEELADARRLIEEISLHDLTPQSSRSTIPSLQKQNSESSVGQSTTLSFKPSLSQKSVVKNAVAKPFSSSNSTVSGNSSSVQTPTEPSESLDFLFSEETAEKKSDFSHRTFSEEEQKILKSSSGDVSVKSIQSAIKQAAARKSTDNLLESDETDEDNTMKAQGTKPAEKQVSDTERCKDAPTQSIVMQNNPIYFQQKTSDLEEKINKFNSKKIKMKRANTIDIPKPLNFYEEHDDDDDSDGSLPEQDYHQRRRNTYLALRGPIRVGNPGSKTNLPVFEPKTDNDKKFLAFISKHNENNVEKNTATKNFVWSKPELPSQGNIWSNKFGKIKTNFEKASSGTAQSQNSARLFWKSADDAITSVPKYDGPKISKQSAQNLRQMFEEKQKQSQKMPWSTTQNDKNIVTGSLRVKAFEPQNEKSYKFVPQPLPVNKFSHAPQSAFKPIQKKPPPPNLHISKTPIKNEDKEKDLDSPLFLYSPKPPLESSLKPWVTSPGESRVLSLAASKFENVAPQETVAIKPRKLSKDKITLPFQQQTQEKLTAPYLVKSVEQKNNTVKQLSGQYDNYGGKSNDIHSNYSSLKYSSPQEGNYNQSYRNQQVYNDNRVPSQVHYGGSSQHHSKYSHNTAEQNKPNYYSVSSQQYQPHQEYYKTAPQQQIPYSVTTQQYMSHQDYNRIPPQHTSDTQYSTPSDQYYSQRESYQNQHQQYGTPVHHNYVYPQNQVQNPNYASHAYVSQTYTHPKTMRDSDQQQSSYPHHKYPEYNEENINRHHNNIKIDASAPEPVKVIDNSANQSQHQNETQYTSTYQYQPKIQTPPLNKKDISQEKNQDHPSKLQSQVSVESVKEYNAVSSRVMTGPVSQQATTIRQKSPMNRNEHDMAAALSLRNALQKVSPKPDGSPQKIIENKSASHRDEEIKSPVTNIDYKIQNQPLNTMSPTTYSRSEDSSPSSSTCSPKNIYGNVHPTITSREKGEPPKIMSPTNYGYQHKEPLPRNVSPNSFSYKPREQHPKQISPHSFSYGTIRQGNPSGGYNYGNEKRSIPVHSLEINDNGESVVTSKFQIPVINVPQPESPRPPSHTQMASKAESWNQICMQTQQPLHKPSPRASPSARTVSKSKSTHSLLGLPKQFEAGMSKDEMAQKRRTMEAYLGSGSKSPQSLSRTSSNENLNTKTDSKIVKRSINRLKTSEKASTYRQASTLSRSRTLPDIVCPDMLDETNVDKAFEDLFKSST